MENCVFFLYTCTLGTRKFDALTAYGVIVSSPLTNKMHSCFMLRGQKYYGMTPRAPLALVIGLEPNVNPSI
jgi:hypothetical protein